MRSQHGLTLIELMVTLAVAVTLLAIGVPAMDSMTASNNATRANNSLVAALRLARVEAINRSTAVTLCALANPFESGTPGGCVSAGTAQWRNGFRVFVDDAAAGSDGAFDAGEQELRLWQAQDGSLSVAAENAAQNSVGAFRFNLLGEVQHYVPGDSTAHETDVLVDITHSDGSTRRRCVQILASGLVRNYSQPDDTRTCDDASLL